MRLFTREQAQALDQISMNEMGIQGVTLMGNAGQQVAKKAMALLTEAHDPSILIICGQGNNGGDGFAAGVELYKDNYNVRLHSIPDPETIGEDSGHFFNKCESLEIPITFGIEVPDIRTPDLIIDGIFGTGFIGELRAPIIPWVHWIRRSDSIVLSIDIPSGLDCNSGRAIPEGVKAHSTVTFGSQKVGMSFRQGPDYSGEITLGEIGFPPLNKIDLPGLEWDLFTESIAQDILKKPRIDTHKHASGKVLVIAGSKGMTGAAVLSTFGALRSGAGLTMTTSPSSLNEIYERSIIEGMTLGLDDHGHGYLSAEHFNSIMEKMAWADAVVLGPGLGREKETQQLIKKLVQTIQKPLVLDADGLFPFSGNIGELNQRRSPLVITPHLGELANLSGIEKENIVSDFPNIMEKFMADFNHVALVKQVPSCTFFDNRAIVNSSGNPGLATGGTGDVLSGMIASLIAQGITPFDAASLGTFIHGKTSDQLVMEKGYRGQIASDLIEKIPGVIAQYENA